MNYSSEGAPRNIHGYSAKWLFNHWQWYVLVMPVCPSVWRLFDRTGKIQLHLYNVWASRNIVGCACQSSPYQNGQTGRRTE